jgi:hypothetical protein
MANTIKPNSGHVPVTSAEEVRHFAGPVTDHTVAEILGIHPTMDELEIAALHARGQSGRPEKSVEELSGPAALLFDLLMQDEMYLSDER